jgi:hypothetical protein
MVYRFSRLVLLLFLCGIFSSTTWAEEPSTAKSLWQAAPPAPAGEQPATTKKAWVLREREITLDLPLLQILKDAGARPHPRITVELFNGGSHELDIISTVSRNNDNAVIRGIFKSPSKGDFTFSINGNILVGTLHLSDRLYKIEHVTNGRLRLIEFDSEKFPPD